jgi:hypothetical protein
MLFAAPRNFRQPSQNSSMSTEPEPLVSIHPASLMGNLLIRNVDPEFPPTAKLGVLDNSCRPVHGYPAPKSESRHFWVTFCTRLMQKSICSYVLREAYCNVFIVLHSGFKNTPNCMLARQVGMYHPGTGMKSSRLGCFIPGFGMIQGDQDDFSLGLG